MQLTEASATARTCHVGQSLLLAALALSGVQPALAENPPERATIAWKYLDYLDMQPGWDRVGVKANAVSVLAPVAGDWSIGGSWTRDVVSGASPAFHSEELLSADFDETRLGREAEITRFFDRGSLSLGWTDSQESDYTSRGWSLTGSFSTLSRNTTFTAGASTSQDRIDVAAVGITQESKNVDSWSVGVVQVLTPVDLVRLDYTRTEGDGYFSDPYKFRDNRPGHRQQDTVVLRWNHHFVTLDASLRLSWRWYTDSFGVDAHTLGAEYVQAFGDGWTVTPSIRLHAQSQADFYLDPRFRGLPAIVPRSELQSQDQRLATFGAVTAGIKAVKRFGRDWTVDVELARYEQRSGWYPFGGAGRWIEPFSANLLQFGVSRSFGD
jgi:hypothetical protein